MSAAVVCYYLLCNTNLHVYGAYRCTAPSIHMASHSEYAMVMLVCSTCSALLSVRLQQRRHISLHINVKNAEQQCRAGSVYNQNCDT